MTDINITPLLDVRDPDFLAKFNALFKSKNMSTHCPVCKSAALHLLTDENLKFSTATNSKNNAVCWLACPNCGYIQVHLAEILGITDILTDTTPPLQEEFN